MCVDFTNYDIVVINVESDLQAHLHDSIKEVGLVYWNNYHHRNNDSRWKLHPHKSNSKGIIIFQPDENDTTAKWVVNDIWKNAREPVLLVLICDKNESIKSYIKSYMPDCLHFSCQIYNNNELWINDEKPFKKIGNKLSEIDMQLDKLVEKGEKNINDFRDITEKIECLPDLTNKVDKLNFEEKFIVGKKITILSHKLRQLRYRFKIFSELPSGKLGVLKTLLERCTKEINSINSSYDKPELNYNDGKDFMDEVYALSGILKTITRELENGK